MKILSSFKKKKLKKMDIKIGLFGGGGVEKTELALRYLKGEYTAGYIRTIEDEFKKVVEIDGKPISLTIIETAGQDDFAEMRYSYFKQVHGMIFVFDIGNPSSIDDMRSIYNDALDANDGDDLYCAIAANKCHLRDEGYTDLVPVSEYKKLEDEFKCKVFETSPKTAKNVDEIFNYVAKRILYIPISKRTLNFENVFFDTSDYKVNGKFFKRLKNSKYFCVATRQSDNSQFAAKINVCKFRTAKDQQFFMDKSMLLLKLKHPAIAGFYGISFRAFNDSFQIEPTVLTEFVKQNSIELKNLNATQKIIILIGIAHAMKFAHEHQVFHLNLKLSNIILDEKCHPKITDFNMKYEDDEMVGSEAEKIDVYMFAMILYDIISDEKPLKPLSLKDLMKQTQHFDRPYVKLIARYWRVYPKIRPSFYDIYRNLVSDYRSLVKEKVDESQVDQYVETLDAFIKEQTKKSQNESNIQERDNSAPEKFDNYSKKKNNSIEKVDNHSEKVVNSSEKVENHSNDNSSEQMKDSIQKVEDHSEKVVESLENVDNDTNENNEDNCYFGNDDEEHFETVKKLGEGMNSIVFKIIDKRTNVPLCKKVLKVENASFKDMQNAVKEFEILHNLRHPCLCYAIAINTSEVYCDENETDDEITTVAIFLEFIDFTFKDCLSNNMLNNTLKTRIVVEICHAMRYLHSKGLIYRDLKIDNIMLNSVFQVKLIDFGLARFNECLFGEETMNSISMTKCVGDAHFMSPEMMKEKEYDNKTDVFSFGIVLFYIFVGKLPEQTIKEKAQEKQIKLPDESPSISQICIDLISMCISFDPKERPSFDEILCFLRKNKFMLSSDVDPSIVEVRDNELESIKE